MAFADAGPQRALRGDELQQLELGLHRGSLAHEPKRLAAEGLEATCFLGGLVVDGASCQPLEGKDPTLGEEETLVQYFDDVYFYL